MKLCKIIIILLFHEWNLNFSRAESCVARNNLIRILQTAFLQDTLMY